MAETRSGVVARERLAGVLLKDHSHVTQDGLSLLLHDVGEVLSLYLETEEPGLGISLERRREGGVTLTLKVPVRSFKPVSRTPAG